MSSPVDLGGAVVSWLRHQRDREPWPYHPRRTVLTDFVRRKFLSDLLQASPAFKERAARGELVCDLNVTLAKSEGQARKLDLCLGAPLGAVSRGAEEPLQKARIQRPLLTLETKLCMTEHRKATTRLISELHSSREVVRSSNPGAIVCGIVIVNVAHSFTSPLNLPGPNVVQRPVEIERLIKRVLERVPSGGAGYDALSIVLVDTDNETRFEVGALPLPIPAARRYSEFIAAVAARLDTIDISSP